MLKSCDNCSYTVTASAMRTGIVYYDNQGNAIRQCPKCGQELKHNQLNTNQMHRESKSI